jgi:hypothetical protein
MKTLATCLLIAAGLFAPRPSSAQDPPPVRARIDSLLVLVRADSVIRSLGQRFLYEIDLLAPDLTAEQRGILAESVATGFDTTAVREDVARAMSAEAPPSLVTDLLERHRTGAIEELDRLSRAYQPPQTFLEFSATMGTPPRERLQIMVALAEAQGAGTRQIVTEEILQESAHALFTQLGGSPAPFQRRTDAQFEEAYRQHALRLGLQNLHRLSPVSDDVVRRAVESWDAESGRWYVDAYADAFVVAIAEAAKRVAELTVVGSDAVADAPAPDVDPNLSCFGDPCGFVVDWGGGSEPTAFNMTYGAPAAIEARVLENLTRGGYHLARELNRAGLTITLRPRLTAALCEIMSGTDNRVCEAIGEVRVEFIGRYRDRAKPDDFTILNRCGSDGLLDVDGLSALVAARIHYAFTTYPGDERQIPRC